MVKIAFRRQGDVRYDAGCENLLFRVSPMAQLCMAAWRIRYTMKELLSYLGAGIKRSLTDAAGRVNDIAKRAIS